MSTGFESNVVAGEIPCRNAVARTIGLNDEPGCRSACVARLNWLSRKFDPPTIARTAPVRGSIATSAADGPPGVLSTLSIASMRRLLEGEVDRGRHLEPAAEDPAGTIGRDQLVLDVVDEVLARPLSARQSDVRRLRQGGPRCIPQLARGDLALVVHRLQHVATPLLRSARMLGRVVQRRVRRQSGEQRRLRQRQALGALAEVRPGGLLDPVGAVSEIDRVQVREQDPIFRPALLELPGERRLAHLAGDRPLVPDVGVLDELLRDRRPAFDDALRADVLPQRPRRCRACRRRCARRSAGPRPRRSPGA